MAFFDPNDPAFDPSSYGSQQPSYLLKTRKKSAGGELSQKNADAAFERYIELAGAKDDYSQAQMAAMQRSKEANMDDRIAMAAQYAGPKFSTVRDMYLKKAMAGREPTQVGNAMIGPDGTVIRDVGADRMRQAELQLRLGEKYAEDANRDEQRANRDYQIGLNEEQRTYQRGRDLRADAAAAAKAERESELGFGATDSNGFTPEGVAVRLTKGSRPFTINNGVPTLYSGEIKYPSGAKDPTEDMNKATMWYLQANNARKNMERAVDLDPNASMMTWEERSKLLVPLIGQDIANEARTAPRQMFVQAASSMGEALLRAATGAGINNQEAEQKVRELVPQIGDKAPLIKQKMNSYDVYMAGLKARAGRGLNNVVQPNAAAPNSGSQIIDLPSPKVP